MSAEAGGSSLTSSFTDLMTSLAVIFILLFVSSLNNQGEERQKHKRETQTDVVKALGDSLDKFKERRVRVEPDESDPLIVRIITPEELLRFEVDKFTIPTGGREFLTEFAPALVQALSIQNGKHLIASLVVEGHTDKTGKDAHNLELSQQRASAVSLKILEILDRDQVLKDMFMRLQSTAGRGSAEPIHNGGNDSELKANDNNRRVVFKVRLLTPEDAQLPTQLAAVSPGGDHARP